MVWLADKKRLDLLRSRYSKSKKILLYSNNKINIKENNKTYTKEKEYIIDKGIKKENIVLFNSKGRTYYELEAVKNYLIDNNYKSAIIITDPLHSRRVSILAKYLLKYDKSGLKVVIVSSDAPWWSESNYNNSNVIAYAYVELLKIPYNIIKYSLWNS